MHFHLMMSTLRIANVVAGLNKLKEEPIYHLAKSFVEVIIAVLILIYFLILRYLEIDENWKYLLFPIAIFCLIHLFIVLIVNVMEDCIKELFKNPYFSLIWIIHLAVIAFNLYEGLVSIDEQVSIIIGFGRWFRIILFYVIVQTLALLIIQKWKKSNRLGIEIINQMSTLEKLLNDILLIVQTKEDIENSDSKKSQGSSTNYYRPP